MPLGPRFDAEAIARYTASRSGFSRGSSARWKPSLFITYAYPSRASGSANPNVPPGLVAFLDRALAKNPDERFQTGEEFAAALRAAAAGGGAPPQKPGRVTSVDIEL